MVPADIQLANFLRTSPENVNFMRLYAQLRTWWVDLREEDPNPERVIAWVLFNRRVDRSNYTAVFETIKEYIDWRRAG